MRALRRRALNCITEGTPKEEDRARPLSEYLLRGAP